MTRIISVTLLFTLLVLSGCAANHVDATKTAKGFYAPSNANNVEILQTKPDRHYVELGTLTSDGWSLGDVAKMPNALRSRASALGADAVLIVSSGQTMDPVWGNQLMWSNAVAIKYQ